VLLSTLHLVFKIQSFKVSVKLMILHGSLRPWKIANTEDIRISWGTLPVIANARNKQKTAQALTYSSVGGVGFLSFVKLTFLKG